MGAVTVRVRENKAMKMLTGSFTVSFTNYHLQHELLYYTDEKLKIWDCVKRVFARSCVNFAPVCI